MINAQYLSVSFRTTSWAGTSYEYPNASEATWTMWLCNACASTKSWQYDFNRPKKNKMIMYYGIYTVLYDSVIRLMIIINLIIFKRRLSNETIESANKISLKIVLHGPIDNIKHWLRLVTSHYLNQWWASLPYMRHSASMSYCLVCT